MNGSGNEPQDTDESALDGQHIPRPCRHKSKFFFDNCISKRIARALLQLGDDVIHIADWEGLDEGAKDPVRMPVVAEVGCIAITDDHRIRKRPNERELRKELELTTVFFPPQFGNGMRLWQQVIWVMKHWENIRDESFKLTRGQCLLVKLSGKTELFRTPMMVARR